MQKTVFVFAFFSCVSLVAMEDKTAVAKKEDPCNAWLTLVKAAAAQYKRADQAELARAVAMAQSARCKPTTGTVSREFAEYYRKAGAQVSCPEYCRVFTAMGWVCTNEDGKCTFIKRFSEEKPA